MTLSVLFTLAIVLTSCNADEPGAPPQAVLPPATDIPVTPGEPDDDNNDQDNPMSNNLKITVGSTAFNVILEDNATAKAFTTRLPITVNMSELNGNEKYFNLSAGLPAAAFNPGTIRTGDLMLYGSATVVLFYQTFSTSYSYTRIGRVNNPSGLAYALGAGRVQVKFELQ